jgi:hypothetical protein
MIETTPDRISSHSFAIIFRSRTAAAISKIPVTIDHAAMNDSRMSAVISGERKVNRPRMIPATPSRSTSHQRLSCPLMPMPATTAKMPSTNT